MEQHIGMKINMIIKRDPEAREDDKEGLIMELDDKSKIPSKYSMDKENSTVEKIEIVPAGIQTAHMNESQQQFCHPQYKCHQIGSSVKKMLL
eukprot:9609647-Ditylum_brightwellii.AAC.1